MILRADVNGALFEVVAVVTWEGEGALIEEDTVVACSVLESIGGVAGLESTGSFLTTIGFSFLGMTTEVTKRVAHRNNTDKNATING